MPATNPAAGMRHPIPDWSARREARSNRSELRGRRPGRLRSVGPPCGTTLTAGTLVRFGMWATRRDPRWFPEPDAFRLQRWAAGAHDLVRDHAWFPFGGGPQGCLGARFALVEEALVLATLARRFTLDCGPGVPAPTKGAPVQPPPLHAALTVRVQARPQNVAPRLAAVSAPHLRRAAAWRALAARGRVPGCLGFQAVRTRAMSPAGSGRGAGQVRRSAWMGDPRRWACGGGACHLDEQSAGSVTDGQLDLCGSPVEGAYQ
jgi:hypothetical protein